MNFLSQVPQQSKLNPAYYTSYKAYIGFPGLSGVQVQLNNDALSYNRAFLPNDTGVDIRTSSIISHLSTNNNFGFDVSADILSFGIKIKEKNQLHFGLSVEGYGNLLLTKNAFNLLLRGSGYFLGKDEPGALSGNSIDMSVYSALSAGYARRINDKLSVGGRVKFLSGMANLYTEQADISLHIDDGYDPNIVPYTHTFTPNVTLMGSFANSPQDSSLLAALRGIEQDIGQFIGFPKSLNHNPGIAFDLGLTYQVNDALTLAAAVRDIGFIKWNTGVKRVSSRGEEKPFEYAGVSDFLDMMNDNGFDIRQALVAMKDSLIEYLQLDQVDSTFSSYRGKLRTAFNISAFYDLTDNDHLGLMWNMQINQQKGMAITLAYTRTFSPNFSICVTNAILNQSVINFGGGFVVKGGPIQFYLVADKISAFQAADMRGFNLQFGLNVVLNRIDKDPTKRKYVRDYTPRDKTGYVRDRWAY
ncbi:MAG: DUF5723 family protein [Bacteroidales bacterium]|nr:DUF5723 family protein [Bacteroidales bacterium]